MRREIITLKIGPNGIDGKYDGIERMTELRVEVITNNNNNNKLEENKKGERRRHYFLFTLVQVWPWDEQRLNVFFLNTEFWFVRSYRNSFHYM